MFTGMIYSFTGKFMKILVIIAPLIQPSFQAKEGDRVSVPSSSCGIIHNISYPFRISNGPTKRCWYNQGYELDCENNVTALLTLDSKKYEVQAINYSNFTIRLSYPRILDQKPNCSFTLPELFSRGTLLFSDPPYRGRYLSIPIIYLSCAEPVIDDSRYVDVETSDCVEDVNSKGGHFYAVIGSLSLKDLKVGCQIKFVAWTSTQWWVTKHHINISASDYSNIKVSANPNFNVSYTDIRSALAYGFDLSWLDPYNCEDYCGEGSSCSFNYSTGELQGYADHCYDNFASQKPGCGVGYMILPFANGVMVIHAGKVALGTPCVIILLIYKWRRRHLSIYHSIEDFLQDNNNLMPIRYSYSQIRKMTKGFKNKLGEGGFGYVFRGKLQSGRLVAVKILGKSKANGQDFISEVATIGRIHHFNIVQLIGYCVEGSKHALIYEFLPNGSLDKYVFLGEESNTPLSIEKMYAISLGVARGIAYLHQGCDMQILHFDIKPHNILLDGNFTPKVSDFGLAKLYPVNHSIVTMTAARGTMGYMAPELFYKNIGGVSYKADVYSFGMLLLEMAGRRKNLNPFVEKLSQIYFPSWVYDQLMDGKDIEIGDATEEERKLVKKMIVMALWCIQMKPSDRPSMNKVVEMLEEVECPEMPPKPFLSPEELPEEDMNTNPTMLSPVSSDDSSESIGLIPNAI
ncbi:putative Kinase [Quillaja saponaria]|uniref:Kinase n=1 Tax=Quillaja saponaria TaxID=32244 RepID=A0AAD7LW85_QUISA|nr:putative Kinase [Quillaja saponaria]